MSVTAEVGLLFDGNAASALRLRGGRRMADEPERKANPVVTWITANLNIPTLLGLGAVVYAVLNGNFTQDRDIAEIKRDRLERSQRADQRFTNIENSLTAIGQQNIPYRITVVESEVKATNGRIDELARQVNAGLSALRDLNVTQTDLMRKDISSLAGDVRVLSTKLDGAMTPRRPVYIPSTPEPDDPSLSVYPATLPPSQNRAIR